MLSVKMVTLLLYGPAPRPAHEVYTRTMQLLHELVKLRLGHFLTAQEATLDMLICW